MKSHVSYHAKAEESARVIHVGKYSSYCGMGKVIAKSGWSVVKDSANEMQMTVSVLLEGSAVIECLSCYYPSGVGRSQQRKRYCCC